MRVGPLRSHLWKYPVITSAAAKGGAPRGRWLITLNALWWTPARRDAPRKESF